MKKIGKFITGVVLGSIIATGASAAPLFIPKKTRGATIGIQTKSVSFDNKLGLKDNTVYGLFYDINFDFGQPLAWGMKIGFSVDYAKMTDSAGEDFNYYDYYAVVAPSYAIGAGAGNIKLYAGAKFGYNGFENSTGYAYGGVAGVEYNYKALNLGVNYFTGTTDIEGFDFDISEIKGYVGYNF
jgi:hypothetical protein